jgi:hypothetical protein
MKNLVFLTFLLFSAPLANAQLAYNGENEVKNMAPSMNFESQQFHFGDIAKDEPVTATFEFENTGGSPLVITGAKGSCGCTVADYTNQPVLPGEKGQVTATYNAKTPGSFTKTVTVYANTAEGSSILTIKGVVVE